MRKTIIALSLTTLFSASAAYANQQDGVSDAVEKRLQHMGEAVMVAGNDIAKNTSQIEDTLKPRLYAVEDKATANTTAITSIRKDITDRGDINTHQFMMQHKENERLQGAIDASNTRMNSVEVVAAQNAQHINEGKEARHNQSMKITDNKLAIADNEKDIKANAAAIKSKASNEYVGALDRANKARIHDNERLIKDVKNELRKDVNLLSTGVLTNTSNIADVQSQVNTQTERLDRHRTHIDELIKTTGQNVDKFKADVAAQHAKDDTHTSKQDKDITTNHKEIEALRERHENELRKVHENEVKTVNDLHKSQADLNKLRKEYLADVKGDKVHETQQNSDIAANRKALQAQSTLYRTAQAQSTTHEQIQDRAISHSTTAIATHRALIEDTQAKAIKHGSELAETKRATATNKQAIAENRGAVSDNSQRITNNSKGIESNRKRTIDNSQRITSNSKGIEANRSMMRSNTTDIAVNRGLVKHNAQGVQHNRAEIADVKAQTNRNTAEIKDLRKDLEAQSKRIDGVAAGAAAMASLVRPYGVGNMNFTVGLGHAGSANAIAVGSGVRFTENVSANLSATYDDASEQVAVGAGIGFEF